MMGSVAGRIERGGPFCDIKVMASPQHVALLKAAGQPYPAPIVIRSLIDTGASCSLVERGIIRSLQLMPTGSVPIHTPSTGSNDSTRNQYDVTFVLGETGSAPAIFTVGALESEFASEGFMALIGWDVLRHCVLICDGPAATFTLYF